MIPGQRTINPRVVVGCALTLIVLIVAVSMVLWWTLRIRWPIPQLSSRTPVSTRPIATQIDGPPSPALFRITVGGRYGYITRDGAVVIQPGFIHAQDRFVDGRAWVSLDGRKYGYINIAGDVIIAPVYDGAKGFSDSAAAVRKSGKWGFIDLKGNPITGIVFDTAEPFVDGIARVGMETLASKLMRGRSDTGRTFESRAINLEGAYVSDVRVSAPGQDVESFVGQRDNAHWVFVDASNGRRLPGSFEEVQQFQDGLAPVRLNGFWGMIDTNGDLVVEPKYNWVYGHRDGLIEVAIDGKAGYVDRNGRIVWSPSK